MSEANNILFKPKQYLNKYEVYKALNKFRHRLLIKKDDLVSFCQTFINEYFMKQIKKSKHRIILYILKSIKIFLGISKSCTVKLKGKMPFLYSVYAKIRKTILDNYKIIIWKKQGCPCPPPYIIKQRIVKQYIHKYGCKILVESGTYLGEMGEAMKNDINAFHSIEIYEPLYRKAINTFKSYKNFHFYYGDSAIILPKILNDMNEKAIFWLDGHYSGEGTGRAELDSPIMQELEAIFNHQIKEHVILIDDARLFIGNNGYPTIDTLRKYVHENYPGNNMEIKNDIIRICKKQLSV
jgi:hypothetical protein